MGATRALGLLCYASEYFLLRRTAHWAGVFLDLQGAIGPLTPFCATLVFLRLLAYACSFVP